MTGRPYLSSNTAYTATAATVGLTIPIGIRRVRLSPTTDCFVTIGTPAVDATSANGMYMRVGAIPEEFAVYPGDTISVIQSTAGGSLNVTLLNDA